MDEPIEIVEKSDAITIPPLKGDITIENVTFSYIPNKPVLKDISINISAGSTVALLGSTGSGKSTLIHLLTRTYDIDHGKIILDHQYNLQDILLDSYIPQIGVVDQEPFLVQQSFLDNLTHGIEHYSFDDVINACKIADIDPFIQTRENKYDTIIGERGVTLSGGQKQRVTLARALVRKPRILILDAATSSVDVDTEYQILKNLKQIFGMCTTIIITQRLSTVRNADYIYVLDKGQISEQGTHSDLIAKNGAYAELYSNLDYNRSKNKGAK
jgi:ATP-binding cassette subfamily B protein